MPSAPRPHPSSASRAARFGATLAAVSASAVLVAGLASPGLAATATRATTTPAFPVPASAKVQPTATGGGTPATSSTTTTPTATYAPTTTQPGGAATSTTPATTTGAAGVAQGAKVPPHTARASKLSTPAIALAVLAALLALGCAAWGAARLTAYEPRWTRSARHALSEGGFRASATWAEFTDWLRLGR